MVHVVTLLLCGSEQAGSAYQRVALSTVPRLQGCRRILSWKSARFRFDRRFSVCRALLHKWCEGIRLVKPVWQPEGMRKPHTPACKTLNRPADDGSPKRRGCLAIWFDPEMI